MTPTLRAALVVLLLGWPAAAVAEPYVAAYGGAAFTEDTDLATDLQLNGIGLVDGRFRDLHFEPGPL